MSNKNNFKSFMKKNGFYVALVICVMAAAAASITAVGTILDNLVPETNPNQMQSVPEKQPDDPESIVPSEKPENEIPVTDNRDDVPIEEPAANTEPLVPVYKRAVNGQVIWAFSGDELVKSNTMNDWRTHNGADYSASDGEAVLAIFSGEIVRAANDSLWGNVVEMKLDSGYNVIYAGLKTISVSPGDRISQGNEIGLAGNTSLLESSDPIHVHIEVKIGGKYIDPETLFR